MTYPVNETHDPRWKSWVESANGAGVDFPVQNLPYGVLAPGKIGVAIGEKILDLGRCAPDCGSDTLNSLMELAPARRSELRLWLSRALRADSPGWKENRERLGKHLIPASEVEMLLPARIGDYTDFYASIDHAVNAGRLFRPDQPLLPNYKFVPIAYHGRASSIVVSGTAIGRPRGQSKPSSEEAPEFGLTRSLDYEMEAGFFIGPGNAREAPIGIESAEAHIFGMCLLNDWSARDIQSWEYQPLGPFLAKSFATSISPWIVTLDALAPFRTKPYTRPAFDPQPLPYLSAAEESCCGGLDLYLEVFLSSRKMRDNGIEPARLSRSNTRNLYWTMAQMVAHHTSNGCNLRPGDLLGTGTVSGAADDARGCLLELTQRGTNPIHLPDGEERGFLQDGDEIVMRGYCERDGAVRIGFGECRGRIKSESS